jgi:DNA repair protein RadC
MKILVRGGTGFVGRHVVWRSLLSGYDTVFTGRSPEAAALVMELARRAAAQELGQASVFDSPTQLKRYAALHLAQLEHESFSVIYLDTHHRLIEMQTLFRGTLSQASVYPREVVKEALARNAAALVLAHNHPSGVAEPSRADEYLTQTLKSALQLVDVRVLDHLVVGQGEVVSFAERGLL